MFKERMTTPLPAAAAWPRQPAASRRARTAGIGLLALLGMIVASAWLVPPMLDWGRFRTAIAAIAGAQLGRQVVISGDVALRLLPEAVLTATDVTLPDRGDGTSARIASLRLQLGLGPLLAGRLAVRDLVLGGPVLTLPWPLPQKLANPQRPTVPHAFAAHVENGTLRIGGAEVTGITAAIHGGPEATLAADAGPVASFGAEGFAAFDGQRWRFTTALGAPDADGVSAVDLAVQGQGPARDTGGAMQGTLADGIFQGRVHAGGPDLSLLMPASALSWQAEAPIVASGERIETRALNLSLGGAPAAASFTLQLAAPARLDARLNAASLDLDGWARLLGGTFAGFDPPAIPMRLDLAADRGTLLGGTLGPISGALLFDGAQASVDQMEATLPGGAELGFSGRIERGPDAVLTVMGPATLEAPDLRATLAWLRSLAPPLVDALPAAVLNSASLSFTAQLSPGRLAVTGMAGRLDDAKIAGGFNLAFGAHPVLSTDASFDHLNLDPWLQDAPLHAGMSLADVGRPFTAVETSLHLHTPSASWRGATLNDLTLEAQTGAGGLAITRASAAIDGAALSLSGAIGPDGRLAQLRARATTQDAAASLAKLPASLGGILHGGAGLLHGPADLELAASGPPEAITVQLHAASSDLTLEAEQRRDTLAGTADTTITLLHPGAPRLLALLGFPGAETWLDNGSLALLAHLRTTPGTINVHDFQLDAAEMHLRGRGDIRLTGDEPAVSGDIRAEPLALPGLAALRAHGPAGLKWPVWSGQVHVSASSVEIGLLPVAQDVSAVVAAGDGVVVADAVSGTLAGGKLSGQAALDATQAPPLAALQLQLARATLPGPLLHLPIDIDAGTLDLSLDLTASAGDAPLGTLAGNIRAVLRDARITGFDLVHFGSELAARPPGTRAALQAALTSGATPGFSGTADMAVDHGTLALNGASLTSIDGTVAASGTADLASGAINVTLALPDRPGVMIKLAGTPGEVKADIDLGKLGMAGAKRPRHRR
jgi:hypothetical protein